MLQAPYRHRFENVHLTPIFTLFGERGPSSLGHQGAGKMLDDAWSFDIANKIWEQVDLHGGEALVARGWFDADVAGANAIIVHGGLGESNNRFGDIWRPGFA